MGASEETCLVEVIAEEFYGFVRQEKGFENFSVAWECTDVYTIEVFVVAQIMERLFVCIGVRNGVVV